MEKMKIKKVTEDAFLPTQAHEGDAGWDLYASHGAFIGAHKTTKIDTGVAIALPAGTFGAIYARSGLATKQGLRPANAVGVVDCGYRGNIIVALHNDTDEDRMISRGDRIAQLVVQPFVPVSLDVVDELDETQRGDGGFGSSGK